MFESCGIYNIENRICAEIVRIYCLEAISGPKMTGFTI